MGVMPFQKMYVSYSLGEYDLAKLCFDLKQDQV